MFKIFQPSKSAMQSGQSNTNKWIVEYKNIENKILSSKFCWDSSSDTKNQIKLYFDSLEKAIKYAKKNKISYEIVKPNTTKKNIKNYADNFRPKK